jgi:hypothetical protein
VRNRDRPGEPRGSQYNDTPTTKKELQQLIGKINFVRRFISNLFRQIESFMGLVKIKSDIEFHWGPDQQRASEEIMEYLLKPLVLAPPWLNEPFYVYLLVGDTTITSMLVQVLTNYEE